VSSWSKSLATPCELQAQWLFEEFVKLVTRGGPPDANAIAELRRRYDTEELSARKAS